MFFEFLAFFRGHFPLLPPAKDRSRSELKNPQKPGGFDFLGYHFERGYRWPRKKSLDKLKDPLRAKTQRTRTDSVEDIIDDMNRSLRGWMKYFQHSHWTTFKPLDQWVRQRLRSILRKRLRGQRPVVKVQGLPGIRTVRGPRVVADRTQSAR